MTYMLIASGPISQHTPSCTQEMPQSSHNCTLSDLLSAISMFNALVNINEPWGAPVTTAGVHVCQASLAFGRGLQTNA